MEENHLSIIQDVYEMSDLPQMNLRSSHHLCLFITTCSQVNFPNLDFLPNVTKLLFLSMERMMGCFSCDSGRLRVTPLPSEERGLTPELCGCVCVSGGGAQELWR